MSNLSSAAKEAIHKLDLGLRPYSDKVITEETEKEVTEIMMNCIASLNWDEYNEVLEDYKWCPSFHKSLQEARRVLKMNASNHEVKEVSLCKEETEEEKEERIRKKEAEFFFRKKETSPLCNCGAAFTQFPNQHMSFCRAKIVCTKSFRG